jgi:hypothetical protein
VPLTGGTFAGPELNGKLLPGSSADWQTVLPDGTALGDIRYTLETDEGDLLYVQSRSMRHGLCRTRRLQNRQLRTATNTKNQPSRSVHRRLSGVCVEKAPLNRWSAAFTCPRRAFLRRPQIPKSRSDKGIRTRPAA